MFSWHCKVTEVTEKGEILQLRSEIRMICVVRERDDLRCFSFCFCEVDLVYYR